MKDENEDVITPDIEVTHDQLLNHMSARMAEEKARQSDGGESAAKTSKFLDETGLNSQALRTMTTVLKKLPKKKGQQKAMDIIRSLEVMLPMIKNHVEGQGTQEMDLGDDTVVPISDAAE